MLYFLLNYDSFYVIFKKRLNYHLLHNKHKLPLVLALKYFCAFKLPETFRVVNRF